MHKIFLMGPQGSGKGTQALRIAERLRIPSFGTGQLIREEIVSGSELGQKLKSIILKGELISDVDAADLLKRRLLNPDTENGYVLDGYPRNLSQWNAFDFDVPTHVIVVEIPKEESLKRLGGRLTCRGCDKVGSIHDGLKAGDICDCGTTKGQWYVREDDTPSAIERRLEIYKQDTTPVIAEYEKRGIAHHVDGMGTVEDVSARIQQIITS